jgi:hypothetical protein
MADTVIGFCHPAQWEAGFGRSLLQMVMRDKGKHILDVCPSESSSFLVAGRSGCSRWTRTWCSPTTSFPG